uniref:Uncharacterized protein n=1 Tax=uncultured Desulfobacterium sp. TaxID=201089 RepID=E1Y9W5_9BACT|nr:unknown protein [uncultured Desulfobacterium sp.]
MIKNLILLSHFQNVSVWSRRAKILTTGIPLVFRGLKFEPNAKDRPKWDVLKLALFSFRKQAYCLFGFYIYLSGSINQVEIKDDKKFQTNYRI